MYYNGNIKINNLRKKINFMQFYLSGNRQSLLNTVWLNTSLHFGLLERDKCLQFLRMIGK